MILWLALATLILAIDYWTGPLIHFPIFFLIPVALASWFNGRWWGMFFALGMPLVRSSFPIYWSAPWDTKFPLINAVIRMVVLVSFAWLIDKVATQKRQLEQEIQVLRGILPICSFCKKIQTTDGDWEVMESYITKHSEAQFSHGMCPDCAKLHYPDFFKR